MTGRLLMGNVWHRRDTGLQNEFRYRVLFVQFELDDIRDKSLGSRFISYNHQNIYGINESDHFSDEEGGIASAVSRLAQAHSPSLRDAKITMITQPSFLGYVFNPVSFFLVGDRESPDLVLVEVHNRVEGRHMYVLNPHQSADGTLTAGFQKDFYVSPFLEDKGQYSFSMSATNGQVSFGLVLNQKGRSVLSTRLELKSRPLNDYYLLRAMGTHPFTPHKTVAAIYWQALKLKLKGARYRRAPRGAGGSTRA
jgi:DUF1365 family protein